MAFVVGVYACVFMCVESMIYGNASSSTASLIIAKFRETILNAIENWKHVIQGAVYVNGWVATVTIFSIAFRF